MIRWSTLSLKFAMYLSLFIGLFALITILLYYFQNKIIFFPEILPSDYEFEFQGDFDELNFYTGSGDKINALLFKSEDPKGVVFYSHGNAGSLRSWGLVSQYIISHDYDLLIYDYRGYGKSGGTITESNMYNDANMIYDELTKSYDESQIIVYGRSIGTGVASNVAKNHNPLHLILESPYYNLPDLTKKIFPFIPSALIRYMLPNNEMIPEISCPITIFHGTYDEVIYYGSSLKLETLLKDKDQMIPIEGGHHNDLSNFKTYHEELGKILR